MADTVLSLVAVVAICASLHAPIAQACSCQLEHHQNIFCDAEFVIKATVKNERIIYGKVAGHGKVALYKRYRISIHHTFKDSAELSGMKRKFVYTPATDGLCGVSLQNNTKYILSGSIKDGHPVVDVCTTNIEWSTLTARQIKGYYLKYQHACDCRVITHFDNGLHIRPSPDHCVWQVNSDQQSCYDRFSFCKRRTEGNKQGKCKWSRTDAFKRCQADSKKVAWQEP